MSNTSIAAFLLLFALFVCVRSNSCASAPIGAPCTCVPTAADASQPGCPNDNFMYGPGSVWRYPAVTGPLVPCTISAENNNNPIFVLQPTTTGNAPSCTRNSAGDCSWGMRSPSNGNRYNRTCATQWMSVCCIPAPTLGESQQVWCCCCFCFSISTDKSCCVITGRHARHRRLRASSSLRTVPMSSSH
jgi:hypothetical protein